jgi:hypothetical protein
MQKKEHTMNQPELYSHPQGGWCVAYPTGQGNVRHFTPPTTKNQARKILGKMEASSDSNRYWETVEKPEPNRHMAIDKP